jgi:phage-related protein
MIYTKDNGYKVFYYRDFRTGKSFVTDYIKNLDKKERAKVYKYIEFLRVNKGYLDEPYSRHIKGKIRELRVDFAHNRHRIFYFTFVGKKIILLHAFLKKTAKTPNSAIQKAEINYQDTLQHAKYYD